MSAEINTTMTVRQATVADAGAVAAVHVASWQAAYRGLMPAQVLEELSVARFTERWKERLTMPSDAVTFVCETGQTITGFASIGPSRDPDSDSTRTAELYALYVHPEQWGAGRGYALWRAARERLVARGFHDVTLWVLAGNARARRFYEQVGFELEPGMVEIFEKGGARLEEVRYRQSL